MTHNQAMLQTQLQQMIKDTKSAYGYVAPPKPSISKKICKIHEDSNKGKQKKIKIEFLQGPFVLFQNSFQTCFFDVPRNQIIAHLFVRSDCQSIDTFKLSNEQFKIIEAYPGATKNLKNKTFKGCTKLNSNFVFYQFEDVELKKIRSKYGNVYYIFNLPYIITELKKILQRL